jgi:hypothetical protein
LYLKRAPKKLLKSKKNQSQNNPLENNVKRVPAKSSTLFSGRLFWMQLRFGRNCSTLFSSGLFWRQLRFGGNHSKKTQHNHTCTGSDLAGTGSTLLSGGLFWRQLRYGGNNNKKTDYCIVHKVYVNKKLTQQHNWKKGSSSPRKASVSEISKG